ncbi:MAG TPA: nucleotide exchange factor GrpE [Bacillota bacterium]|nr:nucleotide exchange factor GrpE [Bacillota bacterium]
MKKRKDKKSQSIVNEEFMEENDEVKDSQDNEGKSSQPPNGDCCCREDDLGEQSEYEEEIIGLKEDLAQAIVKQDEYLSMAQRLQADFENYKKRNKNLVADTYSEASCEILNTFLPVLDNLDRAILSFKEANAQESMLKGVEMIHKQFIDCLEQLGVEEIEALGQPFDPDLHEAVMQSGAQEDQEPNTVVDVLQKGYRTKDRVIRYSMVNVVT